MCVCVCMCTYIQVCTFEKNIYACFENPLPPPPPPCPSRTIWGQLHKILLGRRTPERSQIEFNNYLCSFDLICGLNFKRPKHIYILI